MATFLETFANIAPLTIPTNWTPRWEAAQRHRITGHPEYTDGRALVVESSTIEYNARYVSWDTPGENLDIDVRCRFRVPVELNNTFRLFARANSFEQTGVCAEMIFTPASGEYTFNLRQYKVGAYQSLGATGVDWRPNEWMETRLRIIGQDVTAYWNRAGEASTPMLQGTAVTSMVDTAGYVGVGSYSLLTTIEIDSISVGTAGDVSPDLPALPVFTEGWPTGPSNFKAIDMGRDVLLTWDPVAGATGYEVLRNGVILATITDVRYLDRSVAKGRHKYAVRSIHATA